MSAMPDDLSAPVPAAAAGSIMLGGDTPVQRIGLGARWLGSAGSDGAAALLRRALELGVNLIDTADVYGASEELIAEALHPYPAGLVIATKGGQVSNAAGPPGANGRPEYLRSACEASLRRLRLDAIPLYQLHNADPDVPLEESVGALADLQAEGKVRHVGVSNLRGGRLGVALKSASLASLQNRCNIVHRASDPELERCAKNGLAFLPWEPLAGMEHAAVAAIAGELDAEPAQVVLAWLLGRSPAMVAIPGTTSIEHLESNVAAAALELNPEHRATLDAAATPPS
jgi:pyridoxine 4-dehydrogenase